MSATESHDHDERGAGQHPARSVLFDLDGTLVDSAPGILSSLGATLQELGEPLPPPGELRRFLGPPILDSFIERCGLGEERATAAVEIYRRHYGAGAMFDNSLYPGIVELLERLTRSGITLGVATSKATVFAREILERHGLTAMFATIAGSSLDHSIRTKQQVVEVALAALGEVARPVVMVGDRSEDVIGARAAGLATIGAAWGYGGATELLDAGAIRVASHPAEVAAIVLADRLT